MFMKVCGLFSEICCSSGPAWSMVAQVKWQNSQNEVVLLGGVQEKDRATREEKGYGNLITQRGP
jgi:hypothetical protein